MELTAKTEDRADYQIGRASSVSQADLDDDALIAKAKQILLSRLQCVGVELGSPQAVRDYLTLTLAGLEHEVFMCLFLDTQNRLIAAEEMFRGTLTQTSVYPREIVKAALALNAGAVIFAHNHPSGHDTPSRADEMLTQKLKTALSMVDVKALDHLIVARDRIQSFAETGLI